MNSCSATARAEMMKKHPDKAHDDPNGVTLAPNKTAEILWKFSKAGSFEYSCLIPIHREFGGRCKITIEMVGLRTDCLTTGKSESHVQPLLQKYFRFHLPQITSPSIVIPPSQEGRFAIVTDVGCGMRWTRHVKRRMTLRADGEVVWS